MLKIELCSLSNLKLVKAPHYLCLNYIPIFKSNNIIIHFFNPNRNNATLNKNRRNGKKGLKSEKVKLLGKKVGIV